MGVVYKARDAKLNRLVALKLLPREMNLEDDAVESFLAEGMAASDLNHPNICKIYEILETAEGQLIVVMEYYEGESLDVKLAGRNEAIDVNREAWGLRGVATTATPVRKVGQEPAAERMLSGLRVDTAVEEAVVEVDEEAEDTGDGKLPDNPVIPFEEAVSIGRQIGEGLAAAHAEGIIHRAIKPANVFVTKEGRAVILDFGVTGLAQGLGPANHYMSPEQIRGERVDHQTDIWAAGAVLYEMVSGRKPFDDRVDEEITARILDSDPADIDNDEVRPILQKALVKDKHQRYAAAGALVADLEAIESEDEDETTEAVQPPPQSPKKKLVYGLVVAIVIALIVAVILL